VLDIFFDVSDNLGVLYEYTHAGITSRFIQHFHKQYSNTCTFTALHESQPELVSELTNSASYDQWGYFVFLHANNHLYEVSSVLCGFEAHDTIANGMFTTISGSTIVARNLEDGQVPLYTVNYEPNDADCERSVQLYSFPASLTKYKFSATQGCQNLVVIPPAPAPPGQAPPPGPNDHVTHITPPPPVVPPPPGIPPNVGTPPGNLDDHGILRSHQKVLENSWFTGSVGALATAAVVMFGFFAAAVALNNTKKDPEPPTIADLASTDVSSVSMNNPTYMPIIGEHINVIGPST